MGPSGIGRRKRKRRRATAEDTGILADLEDQATWSSYGQLPRAGDLRRSAIWYRRGWRFYRNLARVRGNPQLDESGFWPAILVGSIGVVVFLVVAILILLAIGRLI